LDAAHWLIILKSRLIKVKKQTVAVVIPVLLYCEEEQKSGNATPYYKQHCFIAGLAGIVAYQLV